MSKELMFPKITYNKEYVFSEYHAYRTILCSNQYTVENKLDALYGFMVCYVYFKPENNDEQRQVLNIFDAIITETSMRLGYEMANEVVKMINKIESKKFS